jgi:hypothetical protein
MPVRDADARPPAIKAAMMDFRRLPKQETQSTGRLRADRRADRDLAQTTAYRV